MWEFLDPNLSEAVELKTRCNELELVHRLTRNTYNKDDLSRNIKFRHYNSIILQDVLYTSECVWIYLKDYSIQTNQPDSNLLQE